MKIKRLEILGFKSFADKTVVEFKDGITGIVGPNGCGKSNIVDAIRWVMGEMSAKHLRGKAMEDVIFSGTEKRPSTGLAEVTLVFSAEDGKVPAAYSSYSEIAVRRRLYRSGESEYAINKTTCRLRDIHDLFLGTGVGVRAYSIIEQGRIGQVITSKPEERRMILEEAAGISKFKSRKEAALRKIEATRANLLRLADILSELKRQLNSLDRQARKAERYREVEKELREIELHLSSLSYLKNSSDLSLLEAEMKKLEESEAHLAAQVSEFENKIEQARLKLTESERELMGLQEVLYEKNNSIQLNQAAVDHKKNEIHTLTTQNQTASQEIEVVKGRLTRLEENLAKINESQVDIDLELGTAEETSGRLEQEIQSALEKEKASEAQIEDLGQKIYAMVQTLSDKTSLKESLSRRKVDLAGRMGRDQGEIDEIDRLVKSHQSKATQLEKDLSEVKQFKINLANQKSNVEANIQEQKVLLETKEVEFTGLKEQMALKNSRLQSLEELERNFEGYKDGVRYVMKRRDQDQHAKIVGTVADLVETESTYEPAVSAVLGERLQNVVVQSQAVGVEALQSLKTESAGRLTCIPMEVRHQENEEERLPYGEEEGVLGPLSRFVKIKQDYDRVGHFLFSDVYLVKSLNNALNIWQRNGQRKTLVTLDGEVVDPAGVVSGGAKEHASQDLLEKKREIKELKSELFGLESQVSQSSNEVATLRSQISHLETSLEALQRDSHSEEIKVVHQEQNLNHLKSEMRRLTERRDKLSLEISGAMQEESDLVVQIKGLEENLSELEQEKLGFETEQGEKKAKLNQTKQNLEALRQQMIEAKAALSLAQEKKNQFEQDTQRLLLEKQEAQTLLEEKHLNISEANQKITLLKTEIETSREDIERLVEEVQEKENKGEALKTLVGQLQNDVQSREVGLRDDRHLLESTRQDLNEKILNLSEARTKVQVLREQILERYHLDLKEIAAGYQDKPLDQESAHIKVQELRAKLEKMGSVNLAAIEEHQEISERHEFLEKQYQDLENSLEGLMKALQKVNRTTKKRLQETFERVNQLFQEVFPRLFKGGRAELRLTDPENILESGVDMVAQPPGKKLQNVNLLSGGEKALTAISLVFSIFLLKPSPFCLLDEVDAPLDDANIDRFNEMVRSMIDRSQFILITHNKRTMEMADVLYGITMEQAGVSKMVSVELN